MPTHAGRRTEFGPAEQGTGLGTCCARRAGDGPPPPAVRPLPRKASRPPGVYLASYIGPKSTYLPLGSCTFFFAPAHMDMDLVPGLLKISLLNLIFILNTYLGCRSLHPRWYHRDSTGWCRGRRRFRARRPRAHQPPSRPPTPRAEERRATCRRRSLSPMWGTDRVVRRGP